MPLMEFAEFEALMTFPTISYGRGFLERSPISAPPSRSYLMYSFTTIAS
jgi:hypothetical protein